MGSRAPRRYGCRVGQTSRRECSNSRKNKVTLVCQFGHVMTIWMCEGHIRMVHRRFLICKTCTKMGRDDIKVREMPLVADLPLRFRTLDAQFDSE
jgi:hypothetical protein